MVIIVGIAVFIVVGEALVLWNEHNSPPSATQAQPAESRTSEQVRSPTINGKLVQYWLSNPFWAAVGMIGALVASRVSTQVVLAAAVGVLSFEVWRVKLAERTLPRLAITGCALIVFAGSAVLAWPKLRPTPLDTQIANSIRTNFPWLAKPPVPLDHAATGEPKTSKPPLPTSVTIIKPDSGNLSERLREEARNIQDMYQDHMRNDHVDPNKHSSTIFMVHHLQNVLDLRNEAAGLHYQDKNLNRWLDVIGTVENGHWNIEVDYALMTEVVAGMNSLADKIDHKH